jgi:hypothetical protein
LGDYGGTMKPPVNRFNRALQRGFNLSNKRYYSINSTPVNSNNGQLGPYLAGLIEGDGHIYVSSVGNLSTKKTWPSYIELAFDIKDLQLFIKIKEILKGGYVTIRPNGQSGRLTIKKRDILINLVKLINGHFRTPKIEALHRLIENLNKYSSESIPLLGLDQIPLGESAWLSGFLEADGYFYLNWKLNKNDLPVGITYYLYISQKQKYERKVDSSVNESNFSHMEDIAKLLNSRVISIERKRTTGIEKLYVVRTDKKDSKVIIFEYLNKFPLFGYKSFAQKNLQKIHGLILSREHKELDGKIKLEKYTENMKKDVRGIEFTHLDKFYQN